MHRRFTDSEVKLARRIRDKLFKESLEESVKENPLSVIDRLKEIMEQPLQPTGGVRPPWWEEAIEEADHNQVWVKGYGWMPMWLWGDICSFSQD